MRKSGLALLGALVVVVGTTGGARGEDAAALTAPVDALADGKVGDWSCLVVTGSGYWAGPPVVIGWTVGALSAEEAALELTVRSAESIDASPVKWKRPGAPSIGAIVPSFCMARWIDFCGLRAEARAVEVKDETVEVSGQKFACRTLAFEQGGDGYTARLRFSFSKEARAPGLVAYSLVVRSSDPAEEILRIEAKIAGHGTAEKTLWGQTAAELDPWSGHIPRDALLPAHGLAKTLEGDWQSVTVRTQMPEKPATTETRTWRVVKVSELEVELKFTASTAENAGEPVTLRVSRRRGPGVATALGTIPAFTFGEASDVKVEPDKKTVGGREFSCQRLSYRRANFKVTIWCSEEAKPLGIVAMVAEMNGADMKWTAELVGFGNGQKTEWSQTPAKADAGTPAKKVAGDEPGFWKEAKEGTLVEYRKLEDDGAKREYLLRRTLKSKDDRGYTVTVELEADGEKIPVGDLTFPWVEDPAVAPRMKVVGDEDLKVDGESYHCQHSWTDEKGSRMDVWVCKGLMVRTVEKGGNKTVTTELTKIVKK